MTPVETDNMTTPKSGGSDAYKFLTDKKKEMKKSQYRERFDNLAAEIGTNLMATQVSYGQKLYEKSGWGSMVFYNKMANGAYDINVYPQKLTDRDQNRSGVPVSQEPIAFSKILIAASVLGGKLPDATVVADDKVYAKASYELWKRSWSMQGGNGANTLGLTYQNLFTYGWAAWRVYPRRVQTQRKGVTKIMFDDVYREPMDCRRTWLGIGFNHGDCWSWGEAYYERDMQKEEFYRMYPEAKKNKRKLEYCSVSEESKDENSEKAHTSVTIGYYENYLTNRYIVACGKMIIYDGELPNDGSHGSIVTVRCFVKDLNDPYGVGLYEMMRGNTAIFTYINSLNAQQVEAEIFPLLFGAQVQNGSASYKRGPNIVNPKHPGTDIDVVKTSGNVQQGILYADKQKQAIEENTGVNNIVAGTDQGATTLGSTVILKEAAYNRLTPPKNSMIAGLELDAHIANTWMKQLYSVDKIFMIDSEDQLNEFTKQNPDYFVESQEVLDDNGVPVGYAVAASKNLRLNFDFTSEGDVMENVPTRQVSAKGLMDEMKNTGHMSDYIDFIIDPDSMLLPSLEIQKQTFMALFPVITNQITLIYSMRNQDPEASASQLMALEKLLDIQGGDIYDYINKADYDAILGKQPSNMQKQMQQEQMKQDAQNTAMQAKASGDGTVPADTGMTPPGQNMSPDGTNPMQPQNPNEMPRPQAPMTSAIDASIGRAAVTSLTGQNPVFGG